MSPISSGSRSRARASSTSSSRRPGSTTCSATVVDDGERYGTSTVRAGQRINLEFVSANPTGPLHAGGGRWVAVGDAIANLLAAQGAEVHREYYLNDAGDQLDTFRDSLVRPLRGDDAARGRLPGPVPRRHGDADARRARRRRHAEDGVRVGIPRRSSTACRTTSAASACTSTRGSPSARCTSAATSRGCSTDLDAARRHVTRTTARRGCAPTDFGDQRDRVLVRSDGTTTYLCNDLAYHRDKFERGWTHLIDIWGADHHGQVKSLQAGMEALGYPPGEPEILLGQFVKLVQDGEEVRHLEAHRQHHHPRRHPRRGRSRRRAPHVPAAGHRHAADVRPRRRHRAVDGEPRLLRAVRARPHRVDRSAGRREPGVDARAARRRSTSRCSTHEREEELLRALALYPDVVAEAAEHAGAAERHDVGARLRRAVPRLLPRLPGAHRRRRAHPGAALADRGVPARARRRARDPRRARARRDEPARRRRRRRGRQRERRRSTCRCCPRRPRSTPAAASRSAASTSPSSPSDSARRSTCTTRTSCAAAAASTAPRSARARRTRARRSCASRWRGSSPRRASRSTSRPAASCTSRTRAGFPADRIVFHGNNKSDDELRSRARRRRRAASSSTRSTSSTASTALAASGAAASRRARAGHARASRRTRTSTSRPAPRTRSSASASTSGDALAKPCARVVDDDALRVRRVPLPHRFADVPRSTRSRARSRRWSASSPRSRRETGATVDELNLGGGLGVRYLAGRRAADDRASTARSCATRSTRRSPTPVFARGPRSWPSPGVRSRRRPASRSTASARSRRSPACARTSRSTAA